MRKFALLAALVIAAGCIPLAGNAGLWSGLPAAAERSLDAHSARFVADVIALRARLALAPHEALLDRSLDIELPMPDGSLQRFSIVDSPIMPSSYAAWYANMKTFKLRGIDDPAVTGRADMTSKGFRAMLSTRDGLVFIDPEPLSGDVYRSALRQPAPGQAFSCGVHGNQQSPVAHVGRTSRPANRLAMNYQTYRIAVSATYEYVTAVGGSSAAARAEILTAINRVNEIYERDLGIRLLLVANDGGLLEDESDRCFTNDDQVAMLKENQIWTDYRIGSAAYDIGHVFGTGDGGIAFLGSACQDAIKAGGVTGQPNPSGDPFYIDYVAHEIGHQLNAEHSFNATSFVCGDQRNAATAFEPGSGSTIMGYAGICGAENLQTNSDATFHASSIAQIDTFTAGGGSCFATLANGNSDPVLAPLADYTIPARTPFRLAAFASDPDTDPLTYQWDQMDSGDATSSATFGLDLGNNPLFRTYLPQTDEFRDFPALGTQVERKTDKAEALPTRSRTLDFRVTVRDGNSGQASDDFRLTVVETSPFRVVFPDSGTLDTTAPSYTILWDTVNTENPPISCANVDIDLLTFSLNHEKYSIHPIAAGVANDGSETFTTPLANSHPRARVRVMCSDNVFYDISNFDVNVTGSSATLFDDMNSTTFFNSNGITVARQANSSSGLVDPFAGGRQATASRIENCPLRTGGDASALEPLWLISLAGLVALVRIGRRYGLQ